MTAGDAWLRRNLAYRAVTRGWPERALLACSGGVDSSALLVLAGVAARRGEISPFIVVHVDHLTRPESAAEGAAVEQLAARFQVQTIRAVVDLDDAAVQGASPEDRLRAQRYAALARVATESGTSAVVTAHTRNDQVETILMRLLGGAGALAAAGMLPRSSLPAVTGIIEIHRPLLDVGRDELLDILLTFGVTPLIDPTNVDRRYRRNAFRQDVVPLLQQVVPGFEAALIRSVTLAARDADALDAVSADFAATHARCLENETRVDKASLRTAHPAIATRVIRWAAGRLMPDNQRELTFERIESVRVAASGRSGATIELPYGIVARVERAELVFERRNL